MNALWSGLGLPNLIDLTGNHGAMWVEFASFTVPGVPVPKERPRATRVGGVARVYTPKNTARFERLVALHVPRQLGRPEGIVKLVFRFVLPRPATKPRHISRQAWKAPEPFHVGRSDIDNHTKSAMDALGDWLGNDNRVVELHAVKACGAEPRTEIRVFTWNENGDILQAIPEAGESWEGQQS